MSLTTVSTSLAPEVEMMPSVCMCNEKWRKTIVGALRSLKYSTLRGNRVPEIQRHCENFSQRPKVRNCCTV